jgi:hypothetical protein
LVSEIKDSVNYGLFIIEHAAGNDATWIGDGGMKFADWDLYTEGTEGIFLPFVNDIKHQPEFSFDIIDFFMGAGADISLGEGHDLIILTGRFGGANEAARNLKMANLLLLYANHLKTGTEPLYLGYRKKGEVWEPFFSIAPAIVYYLKGKLIHASYEREEEELFYNWKVVFRGVQ